MRICVSRLSNQSRDRSRLNSVAFTNIPATVFATMSRTRSLVSCRILLNLGGAAFPRGPSTMVLTGSIEFATFLEQQTVRQKRGSSRRIVRGTMWKNPRGRLTGILLRDGARLCKPLLLAWCTVSDARSTAVTRLWPKKGPVVFGREIYGGCVFLRKNSAHLSLLP